MNHAEAMHWINVGLALAGQQRYEEALVSYERALQAAPTEAEIYLYKAELFKELNRYEEALDALEQAIKLNPHNPVAHYNTGIALLALNRDEEALRVFDQVLSFEPPYALALVAKGVSFSDEASMNKLWPSMSKQLRGMHRGKGASLERGRPFGN